MKKTLKALRDINKEIAEVETSIENVTAWPNKTWDDRQMLESEKELIIQLRERKLELLNQLAIDVVNEKTATRDLLPQSRNITIDQ